MGCGCKNKQNTQTVQTQTTQAQINQQNAQNIQTQTNVQENIKKVIEKYYNKSR